MSKTAAFLVGCSFLAIQVRKVNLTLITLLILSLSLTQGAVAVGIINVNWGRLRRAAERRISSVQRLAGNSGHANVVEQVRWNTRSSSPLSFELRIVLFLNYSSQNLSEDTCTSPVVLQPELSCHSRSKMKFNIHILHTDHQKQQQLLHVQKLLLS